MAPEHFDVDARCDVLMTANHSLYIVLERCLSAAHRAMDRALSNAAQACLKQGLPALALGYALAAIRCSPLGFPQKALHRASVACAALLQPQAGLYFLDLVRCYTCPTAANVWQTTPDFLACTGCPT